MPLSYLDVFPTLAAAAGGKQGAGVDGMNVMALLREGSELPERSIYLGKGAIVTQQWKLVGDELFHIESDPGEANNVAAKFPAVVKELQQQVHAFEPNAPGSIRPDD